MDDLGLDPYESVDDYQQGEVVFEQTTPYKRERRLYRQLVGIYHVVREHTEGLIDEETVLEVNRILTELSVGGFDYTAHIYPSNRLADYPMYFKSKLQAKLLSALEAIAEDYDFEEPSYILGRYMQANSNTINNHINNSSNATASPRQDVRQTLNQEIEISVEQKVKLVEKQLEQNLTEEQLNQIRPLFEKYKENPTKWSAASNLMKGVLGLSKDVAIGVISNIIASQIGPK